MSDMQQSKTGERHRLAWDLIVLGGLVLLAGAMLAGPAMHDPYRYLKVLGVLGGFGLGYALLGRRALRERHPVPLWVLIGFYAVTTASIFVGAALMPAFVSAQALYMPLTWFVAPVLRQAVIATAAYSVAGGVGYLLGAGVSTESLTFIAAVQGLSFGGGLLLGMYITRTVKVSEERARLLRELQAARDEAAALSRAAGVAEERRRLSRDLHDTIAQSLTGLALLAQRGQRDPTSARELFAAIEESAQDALAETRALIRDTAPKRLDDEGLAASLGRLLTRFGQETGIEVDTHIEVPDSLSRMHEVVLLRCAQEGLANVRNHARARWVVLTLGQQANGVELRISDDGVGVGAAQGDSNFLLSRAPTPKPSGFRDKDSAPPEHTRGHGLPGMRDRVSEAGGELFFGPGETGGALLRVRLPFSDAGDASTESKEAP